MFDELAQQKIFAKVDDIKILDILYQIKNIKY